MAANSGPDLKKNIKEQLKFKSRSRLIKKHARRVEGATLRHAHRFLISRWDKIREIRFHVIAWMTGVGVLICIVGLQMIWFQQSYITEAPIKGGTYAEALMGPIDTLNPLYATSPAEIAAARLVFSSLFQYDMTGRIHGDLASSMDDHADKVFTVHLRRDAHWQDGEPLNARDVVFTVDLMKNTSARSFLAASWQGVGVKYVDEYTVQFTLPAAYSVFPQALTFAILPYHLLHAIDPATMHENNFSKNPVGSGPFSFQLLQTVNDSADRKIVYLNANKDYYGGRPRLDYLQLHAYKDDAAVSDALKTGEVNGASGVSEDEARSLDRARYDIVVKPVNSGVYALFNLSQPALKDQKVRKALQLGTDTEKVRSKLFGNPQRLYLPFVQGEVDGTSKIEIPKPDSVAAASALDKAGWTLKDGVRTKGGLPLQLRIVTRMSTDLEEAVKELAGQWRKLGVKVDVQIFDTSDPNKSYASEILQPHNYDVLLDELVIGGDPDVFAYWDSRGLQNFTDYGNTTSDDLLSSARTTSNEKLRNVKYVSFARQWLSDIPAIGLYQSNYYYVHTKGTEAISDDEKIVVPSEHYASVRYWTAEKARVYRTP